MINIMFYFLSIYQYLRIINNIYLTLFPLSEKGDGEYQLSSGLGHEEWQVHTGLSLNHQESETREG